MTHISLELAKWLKERGCDLPSQYVWTQASTVKKGSVGKWYLSMQKYGEYRAYSWYDLLVTHAKEFWGEVVDESENWGFCPECGSNWKMSNLIKLLQQNKIQEAEDYVRQNSVFANPKP